MACGNFMFAPKPLDLTTTFNGFSKNVCFQFHFYSVFLRCSQNVIFRTPVWEPYIFGFDAEPNILKLIFL